MRNLLIIFGTLLLFFSIAKASSQSTYVVQPGDTLYDISIAHGISWQELASLNKIKDPTAMQIGTQLRLPAHAVPKANRVDGYIVPITAKEKDALVRLVYAEARGESFEGQIAVAAVVLNRVKSRSFPNTVWDVIYQPGQFVPASAGLPQKTGGTSAEAVERALYGEDPTGGALFFYNPATSQALDYWETKTVVKKIGNHNFAL